MSRNCQPNIIILAFQASISSCSIDQQRKFLLLHTAKSLKMNVKTFTLFFSLIFSVGLNAQILNSSYQNIVNIDCPFNDAVSIDQPEDWIVYQTLDNTWNGQIDSSMCINVVENSFGIRISLMEFDYKRPLFLRNQLSAPYPVLAPHNWVLQNIAGITTSEGQELLKTDADCENGICTGIIAEVSIPNEDGTDLTPRYHFGGLDEYWAYEFNNCIVTERFVNENYLTNYALKITVDTTLVPPSNEFDVVLTYNQINPLYYLGYVAEDLAVPEAFWNGTTYDVSIFQIIPGGYGLWGNNLVLYGEDDYPNEDNLHFWEVFPEVQPDEQRTINLTISEYENSTYFQPFVQFRGALVAGSDSVRHELNLINMGAFCINLIEVIFEQNTNFVHQSGKIDLSGDAACMQFRDDAALVIADDATLEFGKTGAGILALRTGGTIELGQNSHLIINNELRMWPYQPKSDAIEDREVFMELNPGSTLEFGELASLTAPFPDRGPIHLNIYMNGGTLIEDKLSPEERKLINKIYPTVSNDIYENMQLFPNPVKEYGNIKYLAAEIENVEFHLIDASGRYIQSWNEVAAPGVNHWEFSVEDLASGVYYLELQSDVQGRALEKVVVE